MTAAVLPLPTTRRTLGARRPVVRREDFTVLRGGAGGDRALHLIDLENLCGAGSTTAEDAARVLAAYVDAVKIGPADSIHIGVAHHMATAVMPVLCVFPGRLHVRSGRDGAETALLESIDLVHISTRFSRLIIASADRTFTEAANEARRLGMTVWQVTGRGGLSRELSRVADRRMRLRLPRPPAEVLAARARRLRSCWDGGTLATGAHRPRAAAPDAGPRPRPGLDRSA